VKYSYKTAVRNPLGHKLRESEEEFHYGVSRPRFIIKQGWICNQCGKKIGLEDLVYIGHEGLVYCSMDCIKEHYCRKGE